MRLDRLRLPFQRQWPDRLGPDGIPGEPVGRVTEQDLALAGDALEPLRDVDGVSGGERVAADRVAGDHLAAVDADADRDPDAVDLLQVLVQALDRLSELRAERSALSASSSCSTGTPNTAMTASPMNFSTVPPWRSSTSRATSK